METAEYNYEDFSRERAGDDKLAIRFFKKAQQDSDASAEAGRPIFKEVDYIQIMIPGDRNNIIVRPVNRQDEARFARQYEHWKKTNTELALEGTPLEAWGLMSLAQIEEYRYFGVRTIEQMADLRDDLCQKIMGATTLKQKAKLFVDLAKEGAPLKKLTVELEKRDNEITTLKQAVEEQGAQIAKLLAAQRGLTGPAAGLAVKQK